MDFFEAQARAKKRTSRLLVMFGFLVLMQRFHWVQGNRAKAMGAIFVIVGLFQFVIVPRLLLALFRKPPQS